MGVGKKECPYKGNNISADSNRLGLTSAIIKQKKNAKFLFCPVQLPSKMRSRLMPGCMNELM